MQKILCHNPHLLIRELDGELFIVDEHKKRIHHLNVTASAIWRLLETPATANNVISVFRHLYPDADQTLVKKTIRNALAWMKRKDILHTT
jgi:hypothetical protein